MAVLRLCVGNITETLCNHGLNLRTAWVFEKVGTDNKALAILPAT
jgi:hypothetical protein